MADIVTVSASADVVVLISAHGMKEIFIIHKKKPHSYSDVTSSFLCFLLLLSHRRRSQLSMWNITTVGEEKEQREVHLHIEVTSKVGPQIVSMPTPTARGGGRG